MIYGNELKKTLKDEKNIVNKMYLNEILLQYRKYVDALSINPDDKSYPEIIAKAMTEFTSQLDSHKYSYNKPTKTGFKKSSSILSSNYIDDYLNSIIKRQKILNNKGISWGKQSFTMNMNFNPNRFSNLEKELNFTYKDSPHFYQLTQKLDLQFRIHGKKNFSKHCVSLPLTVFFIYKKLHSDDMIRIEYFAKKAKQTFSKSKIIVICENLDVNFKHEDLFSYTDIIFVLRKRKSPKRLGVVHADVIKTINDNIEHYLYDNIVSNNYVENVGYIK